MHRHNGAGIQAGAVQVLNRLGVGGIAELRDILHLQYASLRIGQLPPGQNEPVTAALIGHQHQHGGT